MVSGIGTALFYSAFLPWASVCVNTGWKDEPLGGVLAEVSIQEESLKKLCCDSQVLLDVDPVDKTRNKINKETVGVVLWCVMMCYVNVHISEDSSSIKFMCDPVFLFVAVRCFRMMLPCRLMVKTSSACPIIARDFCTCHWRRSEEVSPAGTLRMKFTRPLLLAKLERSYRFGAVWLDTSWGPNL